MNKEFISYEQALALKELGFDEPCFGYYNIDPQLKTPAFNMVKPFEHEWCLPAPTYSAAFRWFREKYGLQGYIYSTTVRGKKDGDRHFSDYCWNINGIDMPFMKTDARDMERVTYEEAELACLDKLIEIVDGKLKLK
jgi:hypothetical protein